MFYICHSDSGGCPGESRRCIHVTSTLPADNVLKITAACSVNLHYMNSASTRPDQTVRGSPGVDLSECWISFSFSIFCTIFSVIIQAVFAEALKWQPRSGYSRHASHVGCHSFHLLNTCHVAY